jgi:transposase
VGGFSTKIHATCDALGNPTAFHLSPGEAHDLDGADALLPTLQAGTLLADKAYYAQDRVLAVLKRKGKTAVIPAKSNAISPQPHDRMLYKERHLIECFFQKLKHYRSIATRYDKTARCFLGGIYLASIVIWLQ